MRTLDRALIEKLVRDFSHGVGQGYDPATGQGSQRESYRGLGYGALYAFLPAILGARQLLVIGSGRGFSVACMALGIEDDPGARVCFVDPGYSAWKVSTGGTDTAVGLWTSPEQARRHFEEQLGLRNIEHLKLPSKEAFQLFREQNRQFDMILVDGDHSYFQSLSDLRQALEILSPAGLLIAHDARCVQWPGVAMAIEQLLTERQDCEKLVLAPYPGLALIQRRQPLITLRLSTEEENDTINGWRKAGEVTARPLDGGPDPRVGEIRGDPVSGLYSILVDGRLTGGFGLYLRTFDAEGIDNFLPDDGKPRQGYLSYGAVLAPGMRGLGYWELVRHQILQWIGPAGVYAITDHKLHARGKPYDVRQIGRTARHIAYHLTPRGHSSAPYAADIVRLRKENEQLKADLRHVLGSRIWRLSAPLRALLDRLR